jgi:hypothetical protein
MAVILLVLGILATGAGIVTIGFGIPISEFTLGNTLIVSGTIALSAGLILIGLAAAVGQLTQIAQALRPRVGNRAGRVPEAAEQAAPAEGRPAQDRPAQDRPAQDRPAQDRPAQDRLAQAKAPILAPPKSDLRIPEPQPEAEPAPDFSATAIERLRSSLGRGDRKAGGADAEEVPLSPAAPAPTVRAGGVPGVGANGAAPNASGGSVDALKKPRLDFLFRSKSRAAPAQSFDKVWPQPGARQPDARSAEDEAEPSEGGEVRTPNQRPPPPDVAPEPEEFRPPAILKSGVVDGMAYTLYADGSIEAQLPQGTVRFGSIAELRAHIENNS